MRPDTGREVGVQEPRRRRTVGWAVGLVVLAPFLAETVASSNTPAVLFPVLLPYYAVVYGLPALFLRELWVRGRLTAARTLLFGLGYTALNEGLVAATWFTLAPGTGRVLSFSAEQAGHAGGVNWAVAVNLVVFHTVYSLMVPVTLAQVLAGRRGRGADRLPWLRRRGAIWCSVPVVVVLAGALTPQATAETCAGPAAQTCAAGRVGAAVLVLAVATATVVWATGRAPVARPRKAVTVPHGRAAAAMPGRGGPDTHPDRALPRVAAGTGFGTAFFASFFALPLAGLPQVAVLGGLLLLAVVLVAAARWCRADGRDPRGDVLVIAGALVPGVLTSLNAWRVGQPLAAAGGAALVWLALRRAPMPVRGRPGDLPHDLGRPRA